MIQMRVRSCHDMAKDYHVSQASPPATPGEQPGGQATAGGAASGSCSGAPLRTPIIGRRHRTNRGPTHLPADDKVV